jgi:hypothetical protein
LENLKLEMPSVGGFASSRPEPAPTGAVAAMISSPSSSSSCSKVKSALLLAGFYSRPIEAKLVKKIEKRLLTLLGNLSFDALRPPHGNNKWRAGGPAQ